MLKLNILQLMYNKSPMNFYTNDGDGTVIKKLQTLSKGYKFSKLFSAEDIDFIWKKIRLHRRISAILIAFIFLFLLYEIIFPKFSFLVNNEWYINAIIIFLVIAVVCQVITAICIKLFEKMLKKHFGEYEIVSYKSSKNVDKKYYNLFKSELLKVLLVLGFILAFLVFVSPFKCAKKMLNAGRYQEVIKLTTMGADIFPIAQEWYALRGYANYKTGNYEKAISDFDTAFKLGAEGFNIMNFDNKIFIKYQLKDYESAINDFDTQIQKSDNDNERDEFLWDKAQFLYNIKDYEHALEIYNNLILRAEKDRIFLIKDRLYLERAQVYKKLGMDELAQKDIEMTDETSIGEVIPKPAIMLDEETFEE